MVSDEVYLVVVVAEEILGGEVARAVDGGICVRRGCSAGPLLLLLLCLLFELFGAEELDAIVLRLEAFLPR